MSENDCRRSMCETGRWSGRAGEDVRTQTAVQRSVLQLRGAAHADSNRAAMMTRCARTDATANKCVNSCPHTSINHRSSLAVNATLHTRVVITRRRALYRLSTLTASSAHYCQHKHSPHHHVTVQPAALVPLTRTAAHTSTARPVSCVAISCAERRRSAGLNVGWSGVR